MARINRFTQLSLVLLTAYTLGACSSEEGLPQAAEIPIIAAKPDEPTATPLPDQLQELYDQLQPGEAAMSVGKELSLEGGKVIVHNQVKQQGLTEHNETFRFFLVFNTQTLERVTTMMGDLPYGTRFTFVDQVGELPDTIVILNPDGPVEFITYIDPTTADANGYLLRAMSMYYHPERTDLEHHQHGAAMVYASQGLTYDGYLQIVPSSSVTPADYQKYKSFLEGQEPLVSFGIEIMPETS